MLGGMEKNAYLCGQKRKEFTMGLINEIQSNYDAI